MTNLHKTLTAVVVTFLALALLSAAVAMAADIQPWPELNLSPPLQGINIDLEVKPIRWTDPEGPPIFEQGTNVTFEVDVENIGPDVSSFSLTLRDETDMKDIGSQSGLSLAEGGTGTYEFKWDTSDASTDGTKGKSHTLAATVSAPGDIAPENDRKEMPVLITPNSNPDPTPVPDIPTPTFTPTPTPTEIYFPDGQKSPQAVFRVALVTEEPDIQTNVTPAAAIWHSPADAKLTRGLESRDIQTVATPAARLFIGGSAVTFRSGGKFLHPFRRGEVIGRVRLEGSKSSRGAFLDIGGEVHYVEQDGTFLAAVAAGTVDIYLRAPGYVPVLIPGVAVAPGDRVTIPDLTLPFGDANGDGVIDIHDLSIAAGNYGATIETKPVR